jgi:hypothetical protein
MIINKNKVSPWYKEFYVWMIILFPVLAIIAGIVTTILAIQTDDGLVIDDYYKEGLEINRTLERDKLAEDYRLQADVQFDSEMEEVIIKLSANTDFVYPDNLSVSFLNATRAGMDREVNMILTEANNYRGNLASLVIGKWYVHIQHGNWRLIKTIYINK